MNFGSQETIIFLLGQLVVAAAIWGGIKAEIRSMHEKIRDAAENADDAHERIDSIMNSSYRDDISRRAREHRGAGPSG